MDQWSSGSGHPCAAVNDVAESVRLCQDLFSLVQGGRPQYHSDVRKICLYYCLTTVYHFERNTYNVGKALICPSWCQPDFSHQSWSYRVGVLLIGQEASFKPAESCSSGTPSNLPDENMSISRFNQGCS